MYSAYSSIGLTDRGLIIVVEVYMLVLEVVLVLTLNLAAEAMLIQCIVARVHRRRS